MVAFAQKTPVFGPKIRSRIWGVPTPPFTDKIRKVVFDPFPFTQGLSEVCMVTD